MDPVYCEQTQQPSRTPTIFHSTPTTLSKCMDVICSSSNPGERHRALEQLYDLMRRGEEQQISKYSSTIVGLLFQLNLKPEYSDVTKLLAKCSGLAGYALKENIYLYITLWNHKAGISKMAEQLIHLIDAIKELLKVDVDTKYLATRESQSDICDVILEIMIKTKDSAVFCKCAKVFILMINSYPKTVEPHFTTIAEIAIAWSKDVNSSVNVVDKSNKLIGKLSGFWLKNYSFAMKKIECFYNDTLMLEKKYRDFEKVDNKLKQIEIKDDIVCSFCIFAIILDCVGQLISEDELKKWILPQNILQAITDGCRIQENMEKEIKQQKENSADERNIEIQPSEPQQIVQVREIPIVRLISKSESKIESEI